MSPKPTVAERFWPKVIGGDVTECWLWTATKNGEYGSFSIAGRKHPAHRVAYELLIVEIPAGLQLDHLCRNPPCVNPWHLEPVTQRVNTKRGIAGQNVAALQRAKTHCRQGHPFDEVNTYVYADTGKRRGKTCGVNWARAWYQGRAKRRAS